MNGLFNSFTTTSSSSVVFIIILSQTRSQIKKTTVISKLYCSKSVHPKQQQYEAVCKLTTKTLRLVESVMDEDPTLPGCLSLIQQCSRCARVSVCPTTGKSST